MIPCKNCITFAVCNAQIIDNLPCMDIRLTLVPKCSLIKDYIESHDNESPSDLVIKVANFFNPKASFRNYPEVY